MPMKISPSPYSPLPVLKNEERIFFLSGLAMLISSFCQVSAGVIFFDVLGSVKITKNS